MADLTTLATVKEWLSITDSSKDALLTRLISAASDFIQTWLNRTLASASYTDTLDGAGGRTLLLGNYPITAVSSVYVDGVSIPQSTSVAMSGWTYDATRIVLRGGYRFTRDLQNVVVSYTAGYVTTPKEVEQSCIELIARRYKERDRIGVSSKTLAGETVTFSQKDMSDAIKTTLTQYRKVAPI